MIKVKKKLRTAPSIRGKNNSDSPLKNREDYPDMGVVMISGNKIKDDDAMIRSWYVKKKKTFNSGFKAKKK